jgi:hypothetical protein
LYRLTFEDEDGKTSECELEAPNLPAALQSQTDISQLIKIERINRIAGEVDGRNIQRVGVTAPHSPRESCSVDTLRTFRASEEESRYG